MTSEGNCPIREPDGKGNWFPCRLKGEEEVSYIVLNPNGEFETKMSQLCRVHAAEHRRDAAVIGKMLEAYYALK